MFIYVADTFGALPIPGDARPDSSGVAPAATLGRYKNTKLFFFLNTSSQPSTVGEIYLACRREVPMRKEKSEKKIEENVN